MHVSKTRPAIIAGALVLALLAGYLLRDSLREIADAWLTRNMFVAADTDTFDPGPAIGSHFPGVHAAHAGGTVTLLTPFAGANGTLLVVNRSLASCPYSRRQMVQLERYSAEFSSAGIGVVAITPDDAGAQQAFAAEQRVTIPLLADIRALSVKTLGLLDAGIRRDDSRYGTPYAGMLVIDAEGIVVGKLFLADYRYRVDSAAALAFAKTALGLTP